VKHIDEPRLESDLGYRFEYLAEFMGFGPEVSWAIVNQWRVRARLEAADARVEAALANYEGTLLRAIEEVENSLTAMAGELERRGSLERSVAANGRSLELARIRYEQGQTSFLDVLDSERALLEAENRLASSQARVATLVVTLYKAIGGGWEMDAPAAAEPLASESFPAEEVDAEGAAADLSSPDATSDAADSLDAPQAPENDEAAEAVDAGPAPAGA